MKVLLTSAETRRGFDTFNIIRNKLKQEVILCSSGISRKKLEFIYQHKVYYLRTTTFMFFFSDLEKILSKNQDSDLFFLPVSEEHILNFYKYIECYPNHRFKYLLPEKNHFELCRNKITFQNFCETNQFPIPGSYSSVEIFNREFTDFPLVIKPSIGTGSVGLKFVNNSLELQPLINCDLSSSVIQKKVTGTGQIFGAFFLCNKGNVISYHGHKRIRTYPFKGGVTVFSQADFKEELKSIGENLLKKLNWNGFAMIEFMYDEISKSWKIIELNPRLWGSLLLTEFSGTKMIENYINLCQNKQITESEFDTKTFIRWWFPFEIINFMMGKIKLLELLSLKKDRVCYINYTYSNRFSMILFNLLMLFNKKSMSKFFKKTF